MKVRCCTMCVNENEAQEATEINENDLFFCDNCGFISFEDTIMLEVENDAS